MPCTACGLYMRCLGTDEEGEQYFECHQDGCTQRHKRVRRWWESGTDFWVEIME